MQNKQKKNIVVNFRETSFIPEKLFKKQNGKEFVPEKSPKKPLKPPDDKKNK